MKTFLKTTGWLVMAAALSFGTAACSSDDAVAEQNVKPTGKYTMVVKASKGDAGTRGLSLNGSTLNVKWYQGEKVEVWQYQDDEDNSNDVLLGTLYAKASDDGETELSGTLDVAPVADQTIYFYLHSSTRNYHEQNGVLLAANNADMSIENDFDYAWAFVTTDKFEISGTQVIVPGGITLESKQAIVKFTLQDQAGNALSVTSLTIQDEALNLYGGTSFISDAPIVVTPPSATNVLYVAINGIYTADKHFNLNLTATDADGFTYTYSKPYDANSDKPVVFEHGKYYTRTVKMNRVVDLSKTSIYKSNVFTAQNGDVLTGTVPEGKAVYVASGAEVTLRNATINCDWTYGLFCWGNNTINLEGTNTASSIDENNAYDGINCYDGALTIQGSGSLTATGCNGGAGITCYDTGSITIKGGTITATGSYNQYSSFGGAGIGGVSSCGNIIIEGGTIEATGGNYAAGIGGGFASTGGMSSCGNITIKSTVTSVTATGGDDAPNSIGAGYNGTCGTVTIEDWSKVTVGW